MSHVPSTRPEISSRDDTSPDSLLARLRKITGLTEADLPPPPAPSLARPRPSAPPVDRVIVWLRELTGVLTACFVAVALTFAVAVLWLSKGAMRGARWSQHRWREYLEWRREKAEAKKQRAQESQETEPAPAPAIPATPVPVEEREFESVSSPPVVEVEAPPVGALLEPPPPALSETPALNPAPIIGTSEIAFPVHPPEIEGAPTVAAPVKRVPRVRLRRAVTAGTAVLAASPALLLVPAIRYPVTTWLGWGNAAVVAADDGWLFPRTAGSPAPPSLKDTIAALRSGDSTVVVISLPAKAAVYPEKLDSKTDGALRRHPDVTALHKDVTDAGALLLDLGPVLHALKTTDRTGDNVFRAHGSRWSPRAVEKSAAAATAFIQQQPGYAALPLRPVAVELRGTSISAPLDDLAVSFPSRRWHDAHAAEPLQFIRLLTADKKPLAFDPSSPVVLIGGDDLRVYDIPSLTGSPDGIPGGETLSAGFAQYLSTYLSTSLDVHAGGAGSSVAAAKEWLGARPEAERKSKRFILWLLADDDLLR